MPTITTLNDKIEAFGRISEKNSITPNNVATLLLDITSLFQYTLSDEDLVELRASITQSVNAQSNTNREFDDRIHDLVLNLETETRERSSADATINTTLTQLRNKVENQLQRTVDELYDIVPTLASKTELSAAISNEVINRNTAISNAISDELTEINSNIIEAISSEATDRDAAILTAISAEASARDTAIAQAVGAETTARNTAISQAVGAEATARDTAIAQAVGIEANARHEAIAQAIATEANNRNAAISIEVSERQAAVSALANRFVVLTESEYDSLTPVSDRFYFIYE